MTGVSRSLLTGAMLAFLAIGAMGSLGGEESDLRSTADGVYTEDQAKRGQRVQRRHCLRCHFPEFYTEGLMDTWAGNTVGALNTLIANTMPEDRPSSLKPQQYADLIAYLLSLNGFPAGEKELPGDDAELSRIIIQRGAQ